MITYDVHRYTDSTNNSFVFCEDCFAKQRVLLMRLEGVFASCDKCAKKYLGVWSRWAPLIHLRAADEAAPPLAELERFAKEAGLNFSRVGVENDPNVYIGYHGNRRIAFPCVTPDKMLDSVRYSRWRDAFQKCMWFMPAFITNGELEKGWFALWDDCSNAEKTVRFDRLMHELYTPWRQARSICSYYNLREFAVFCPAIMDALKAAHLGLHHASTSALIIVVEAILKAIRLSLSLPPPPPHAPVEIRGLVKEVFDGVFLKICSYRGYGRAGGYVWIPQEYANLECLARQDDYFMFLILFRDFLLSQLFAKTADIDMSDPRVLNRHVLAHGLAPARGIVLDTMKLIGVMDALASVIGQVTDQTFALYGKFHGARESRGICHEPGSSIRAVTAVFATLHTIRLNPAWVEIDRVATAVLDGIATHGTVFPEGSEPPPPPSLRLPTAAPTPPAAPSTPPSAPPAAPPTPPAAPTLPTTTPTGSSDEH